MQSGELASRINFYRAGLLTGQNKPTNDTVQVNGAIYFGDRLTVNTKPFSSYESARSAPQCVLLSASKLRQYCCVYQSKMFNAFFKSKSSHIDGLVVSFHWWT